MHCRGLGRACDRRHSPTVRSCQKPGRIGRKHNHSSHSLSSSRYVDGIKVLAEQFNQSVLAMVRKAAERVSPADTLGNRRRRRDACPLRSALPTSAGRRPSAAALIAERASRNAVVNIGRTQQSCGELSRAGRAVSSVASAS
jgi:hypothetical protein